MVIPMKFSDFRDFKLLVKNHYKNLKVGTKGERLVWQKVKWVQVRKVKPESVFFNYDFDENNFI